MNLSSPPLVSVITPVYNSENFIEETISSVLSQTFTDWELWLVDDASTDNSFERIKPFLRDPRIKYISLDKNSGAAVARNTAIERAKGRFISFLDSDDLWLPEKMKTQLDFMEEKGVAFSYGDYFIRNNLTPQIDKIFNTPSSITLYDILTKCPIGCLTACYNQELLGKVFMPLTRRGQDWGLWLKILNSGITAYRYPGAHAIYSVGTSSLSSNKLKKAFNVYSIYRTVLNFNVLKSCFFTFKHALSVMFNKKRG